MKKKEKNDKKSFWLQLDNAAKIFPGQNTKTWSNIFRVCYELKEPVNPDLLAEALDDIMPRFPCYDVRMRYGFFWFYLDSNKKDPPVMPDIKNPCHRVNFRENNGFLFRVYYFGNRIAVDFYHVLTDGHGAAIFLSTLTAQYLRLCGAKIPCGGFVIDTEAKISEAELEDSFVKNADSKAKYNRRDKFVYHAVGTKMPYHTVNITSGIMPFDELHRLTKAKGVTVTEYLAAVMMKVLYEKQLREKSRQKEVSIQIPVDLRRVFGSETLRNFSVCMRVKIDPNKGEYTLDEMLEQIHLQLKLANNKKEHNALITANMGIERNILVRAVPLAIKNIGVGISFVLTGEQTTSCLISNIGAVKIPEEMLGYVEKFIIFPGPGKLNGTRIGVATLNNNLAVTFADIYCESDIEREFFTHFVKQGIHVKIESNRE